MTNITTKEQAEEVLYGQKKKINLPSGYYVTIREQNGNDDDILSNAATSTDLSNISIFLSSLILETDLPFANGQKKLSKEAIDKLLLRDKYFIIFSSRVHSMGNIIRFEYDWGNEYGKMTYEEDLNNFLWDYSKPLPQEGDEDYYQYRIQPYPKNPFDKQEFTTRSGKKLRFNLLDGYSEKYLLKLPREQHTRNVEIKARNLEISTDGGWEKVDNFTFFTKRDMAEIHKIIGEMDPAFSGITEIENPNTGQVVYYPIIQSVDFFFPEEI